MQEAENLKSSGLDSSSLVYLVYKTKKNFELVFSVLNLPQKLFLLKLVATPH